MIYIGASTTLFEIRLHFTLIIEAIKYKYNICLQVATRGQRCPLQWDICSCLRFIEDLLQWKCTCLSYVGFFFILAYEVSIKKESYVFMKLAIWIILMMPHNNYSLVKYGASELKINMMEISCLKRIFVKYKEIRLKSSECFPCLTDMYINPTRLHS